MRKSFAFAVLLALLALIVAGCRRTPEARGGPVEITVWHPWGGDQAKGLQRIVDEYHRSQNRVRVRLVYTPTDLSTNQKFFTAIAANKPPDATFVDGTQDGQWAEWGALMPLDSFIAKGGVKPTDFYPPCWKQALYKGHIWSLAYCADPNFAFAWNKDAFRRAGLDPERPPRTIAELDAMSRKLEVMHGKRIDALGIVPWAQYGSANSLFTWGWAFGGHFYDEKTERVTADDPRVLAALQWMVDYGNRLGITRINGATAGWGSAAQSPFITGQLAMTCVHISTLKEYRRYAPNMDFGIAPLPGMPNGEIGSSWIGGWSLALPRGCKHPDAAWDFIRWVCATDAGASAVFRDTGLLPGYRKARVIQEVRSDPKLGMFVKILEDARHQRPTMPAQAYFMGALDRAVDNALYHKQTPEAALKQATQETQRELDAILGKRVR
ncbi:MAG TPA: ABC transporter substrate-binding protein [Armatimonadota bacterium]|jgi:multiple sugar transport system substrate-binding protein